MIHFLLPVHSEHQGRAGEGGPLLRIRWPVLPQHSKDHPSGPGGFQHGIIFPRSLNLRRLLLAALRPLHHCRPLSPLLRQKQEEGVASLHQPGFPPGLALALAEPLQPGSGRGRRLHPAPLSYRDACSERRPRSA